MDTRLLRTFTALARTGNFTATAAELHLSQSTVTVHIRALEKELGARLFDRLPRGARLTAAGRRLLAGAEDVLDAESRLRAAASDGGPPAGRVVVGAGETLCSARLPGVVAALRGSHPGIDVHLYAAGTGAGVEGVRAGRLDVALLLEERVGAADLAVERVGAEPLVLVAASGHPLAAPGRRVTWEELAAEPFFLHEQGCSYSDALARRLLALPGGPPRMTRFGSIEAARSCVAAGLGLTLLPRVCVATALRDGSLAVVQGPEMGPVPVQMVRHRTRWTSPAVRAVLDALRHGFATADIATGG